MRCSTGLVLTGLLLVTGSVRAQIPPDPAGSLSAWMNAQKTALDRIDTFQVREEARHTTDGGFGKQSVRTEALVTGGREIRPLKREFISFRWNNRDIAPDMANRMRRQQRSMFWPDIADLLDSFTFPGLMFERFRFENEMMTEERNGQLLWRLEGISFSPGDRSMAGPGGRRFGGGRPGGAPGEGMMGPPREGMMGPPGGRMGPPEGMGPPGGRPQMLTAWFGADPFQLLFTRSVHPLPGRSRIVVRTTYENVGGIDVPVLREIEGSIPVLRRMRFFAVGIEQVARYTEYEFNFRD